MWVWLIVYLGYVEAYIDPYSLRNHAQLGGGSVAERLMSTMAYGWVEHCSDVAGCGVNSSSKDKCYWLHYLCHLYLLFYVL